MNTDNLTPKRPSKPGSEKERAAVSGGRKGAESLVNRSMSKPPRPQRRDAPQVPPRAKAVDPAAQSAASDRPELDADAAMNDFAEAMARAEAAIGAAQSPTEEKVAASKPVEEAAAAGPSAAHEAAPVVEDDALADAEARVEALEAELAATKDRLLRALADGENTRRRAQRDREEAEKYGGVKLARDILSVHDNLERAMSAADAELRESAAEFFEGLELTQRELLNAFSKHNIAPIEPEIGEKLNPNRHQAMFEAPAPGAQPGTIIQVMQKGFVINERLLRPAMVGVAKAADGAAPAPAPEPPVAESDEG